MFDKKELSIIEDSLLSSMDCYSDLLIDWDKDISSFQLDHPDFVDDELLTDQLAEMYFQRKCLRNDIDKLDNLIFKVRYFKKQL